MCQKKVLIITEDYQLSATISRTLNIKGIEYRVANPSLELRYCNKGEFSHAVFGTSKIACQKVERIPMWMSSLNAVKLYTGNSMMSCAKDNGCEVVRDDRELVIKGLPDNCNTHYQRNGQLVSFSKDTTYCCSSIYDSVFSDVFRDFISCDEQGTSSSNPPNNR